MPHVDAVIGNLHGTKAFETMDFTSVYWQIPMDPDNQPLHAFMTPDGVKEPTYTVQGGSTIAANFLEGVCLCFETLQDCLLTWPEEFELQDESEAAFIAALRKFLDIRAGTAP